MGLVLDSSAAVAAERQGKNARQMLESVALETGDDGIAISVVTLLELAHGLARSVTPDRHELGYRIRTHNVRHFHLIPDLDIIPL